jgi:hypothetical protein
VPLVLRQLDRALDRAKENLPDRPPVHARQAEEDTGPTRQRHFIRGMLSGAVKG